jgi:hypothetical protein
MKLTSKMTAVELAKVWAEHFGLKGAPGGWIYTNIEPNIHPFTKKAIGWVGKPVAHGWVDLANALERTGLIEVGKGINWRASGEKPSVWRCQGMAYVRGVKVV